jgi:hypothetical protein
MSQAAATAKRPSPEAVLDLIRHSVEAGVSLEFVLVEK